jgi:mannose-1-phosphate guanylyltransferase/mannose-6-phosphate isomerase
LAIAVLLEVIQVTPVIHYGGSGTRLWPLSRAGFPKQFLVLSGSTSLFQQAVERVNQLGAADIAVGSTLMVTNEEHCFPSLDQLREIKGVNATLLLGPQAATQLLLSHWLRCKPSKMVNIPFLGYPRRPNRAKPCRISKSVAAKHTCGIVILGNTPDKTKTGYGYIQQPVAAGLIMYKYIVIF